MQRRNLAMLSVVGVFLLAGTGEWFYRSAVRPAGAKAAPAHRHGGDVLYASQETPAVEAIRTSAEPIVITDCRIAVIDKQDVPSQRDGVLLFVGREAKPDEVVAEERRTSVEVGGRMVRIRRWKEGDRVLTGQLLAQLDDRLARDECTIKKARLAAAHAELAAAGKTAEEAKAKYDRQIRLRSAAGGATSEEELKTARLTWEKAQYEATAKKHAVTLAEGELHQAETTLSLHQLRCTTPGVIKIIHKQAGEAIKALEAVVQVHKLDRLRIEGVADVHHLRRLRVGMKVEVEPALSEGPSRTLAGHLQEITAVGVSKDGQIVSADESGSIRVWSRERPQEERIFRQPSSVKSLACAGNLCLTGSADGKAFLWDLAADEPAKELARAHRGVITAVAFSPDARYGATAGEDRQIVLYEAATGEQLYRFPAGHRAAVTCISFTPRSQLVSAGRDNTIRLWQVGEQEATPIAIFDRRSGDVWKCGVSPDGGSVLFDQGPALRVLSLPKGRTEGSMRQAGNFTGFALFSPDGRLVVTPGEAGAVLWRAPQSGGRGGELCQLASADGVGLVSAAFAPDGSFVVAGTTDRRLLVWRLPSKAEIEHRWQAELVLAEPALDANARQVRIWAELPNPDGRLLPGGMATLVIDPK